MSTSSNLDQIARHAYEVYNWAESLKQSYKSNNPQIPEKDRFLHESIRDLLKWIQIYDRDK
jgi:hypothetical protein